MMRKLQKRWSQLTNLLSSIKHGKLSGQWSFLFVKDNGEIISIDRFKELVIILVAVVAITAITATVFSVLYKNEKGKNEHLEKALKTSEQKIVALQEEKDVLMVRLVLAESKIREKRPDLKENTNKSSTEVLPNEGVQGKEDTNTEDLKVVASPELTASTETATDVEMPAVVSIDNVDIFYDKKNNTLNVKFILKTTDAAAATVSGRAFVLLKRDTDDTDSLVIPSVALSSGKPSQIKRGQYFSIANLKWMNFKKKYPPAIKSFKYVTVFIFSTEGELLLEKEMVI